MAERKTVRERASKSEPASADPDRALTAVERLAGLQRDQRAQSQLDVLRNELASMAASIAQTRREIASIKPDPAGGDRIDQATEELDLVVRSTEAATTEILSAAEGIQLLTAGLREGRADPAVCDALETHATNLMVACSFQDLTGQRTMKVVNVLRHIEQRVAKMMQIWGITAEDAAGAPQHQTDNRPDAHLLNGPARTGEGVSQADVDAMLGDAKPASQNDIDQLFD